MAGDNHRERISANGGADGADSLYIANLFCDGCVAAGFAKRNRFQSVPDPVLKGCSSRIEFDGEDFSFSFQVFGQFAFSLQQHRMVVVFSQRAQSNAVRLVVLPKNRRQPFVGCDEFQFADLRRHDFVDVICFRFHD